MPDSPQRNDEGRRQARGALVRSQNSLQQILAQGDEVSRVTRSLRGLREQVGPDALASALESSMRRRAAS